MKRRVGILSILSILLFSFILPGCKTSEDRKLHDSYSLFDHDNDSAKALLMSVDTTRLSEKNKILWHLLQMRCFYFFNDSSFPDTIPQSVETAILKEDNPDWLQEMYFWKGNAHLRKREYVDAMLCLEKNLHYLDLSSQNEYDKNALKAHSYQLKYYVWSNVWNYDEAKRCNEISTHYYKLIGNEMAMTKQNLLAKAEIYINSRHDEKALALIDSIQEAYRYESDTFLMQCAISKLLPLYRTGNIDQYRASIAEMEKDSILLKYPTIHSYKALLAFHDGNLESALEEADIALRLNNGHFAAFFDPMGLLELAKEIDIRKGDYRSAYFKQKRISDYYDAQRGDYVNTSIRSTLDEFHRQLAADSAAKEKNSRLVTLFVCILALVVVAILISVTVIMIRRHRERMAAALEELDSLKIKDQDRRKSIHALLSSRFEIFNRMCDDYFEMSGLKDVTPLKNEIYKNLSVQIKEMRSEKFRNELEKSVNIDLDELMLRFNNLKDLTEEDRNLFLYLASGFSIKAVGIFLDLKKSSVYSRRRRLREKIEQSDSPYKDEFLSYL